MTENQNQKRQNLERSFVERAQAGDPEAFSELVTQYAGRLYSVCYNHVGNRQDAEDCVQETFIKAYRSIGSYNYLASFYTWLYRIAVNTCLDYRRKSARSRTISIHEEIKTEEGQITPQYADHAPLPDEQAEKREVRQMIREEILSLPPPMREIIILRDLEGLSYRELADLLHLSEGTVKSRLSRARQQLMERISKREKNLSGTKKTKPASNR
ncbi:MAG: sigma-70 family RNA polymerase sigma factor [Clostridia bacterium]|nr:sigma-70 family RNA polymerase sigma factor [Clostridia bacterium]